MHLTDRENRMLDGGMGRGVRKAMEMLVALGKTFDADRMIPVTRTHVALSGQEGDTYWCELLVDGGATCAVPPTTNPCWDIATLSKHYEVTEEELALARRTEDVYRRIGAKLTFCCTPELAGNVPCYGEHVAFSESSATPYVNSILGARSNRESSVSALASSVTGVTPYYGLHLDANRRGNMLVRVEATLRDPYDWGLLGWYIGKFTGNRVPVIRIPGLDRLHRPTPEMLLYFGAELNTSGAVPMFHIVGVTPEALTEDAAFGGNLPELELPVTGRNLKEMEDEISDPAGKIAMVMLGCPHYSYDQLVETAELVGERKVHPDVAFWILTSDDVMTLARRSGLLERLEAAGIYPVPDTCMDEPCFKSFQGRLSLTDSAKCAHYQKRRGLPFVLRRLPDCVDAAVKGEIE